MGITLQQIADIAGVHKSTVDKVIHNRPGVSDAKRQMIRKLLDDYGYESNPLAKALNYQKKKMKIAVVMPNVDAMPFLKQGMEIVQQDFNSFNIEVLYYSMPFSGAEGQAACLRSLKEKRISGVVLLPIEAEEVADAMKELQESRIPVIAVNSASEDASQLSFVGQDVRQAGRTAARVLSLLRPDGAELGIISSRHMRAVKQREEGFLEYLPEISDRIRIKERILIEENPENAYENTQKLLKNNPEINALLITCGEVENVCRAVQDLGRSEEMTVVCYERYPAIVDLIRQGIVDATIGSDLKDQGRLAMRLLFEYLIYDRKPAEQYMYSRIEIFFKENI